MEKIRVLNEVHDKVYGLRCEVMDMKIPDNEILNRVADVLGHLELMLWAEKEKCSIEVEKALDEMYNSKEFIQKRLTEVA